MFIGSSRQEDFLGLAITHHPHSLAHQAPELGPITSICAYFDMPTTATSPTLPFNDQPPLERACFSSAPLVGVTGVTIFYVPDTELCRGIIVRYSNQAMRSLGQCRLGSDKRLDMESPTQLCYISITDWSCSKGGLLQVARAESTSERTHKHRDGGWMCCPMRGTLKCWFNRDELVLVHSVA